MSILFLSGDLMFGSQLSHLAGRAGVTLQSAASLAMAREKIAAQMPSRVLIDLGAVKSAVAETVQELRRLAPASTIIAFGPHVQDTLLDQAREAGCDLVLTRGQFQSQMGALVAGTM